jgi:hypothetical protein
MTISDRTWPVPNVVLLGNVLNQTGLDGKAITAENWRKEISSQISTYNRDKVISNVCPFVEKQRDLELLTKETLIELLQNKG